jgi:YegS/Rv2252/BmrU family lipid kinase
MTRPHIFFIINPTANHGKVLQVWSAASRYMREHGYPFDYAFSSDADHVEILAKAASSQPGTIVAGVGGDGTLSRIAGALIGTEAVLGIVPGGTGNDFSRTWNIPRETLGACRVLMQGKPVTLDVGTYNGNYFLNAMGAGLDAEVAACANRSLKGALGSLGYMFALIRQLLTYQPRQVKIVLDTEELVRKVWLVTVANACYYGGGMKVAPDADPRDGLADVIIVGSLSRLNFLRLFPLVYRGRHVTHPAVQVFRSKTVCIESLPPLLVHADGDIVGSTPFCASIKKHAIRLQVPGGNKSASS